MIQENGFLGFGFFSKEPYGDPHESFADYLAYQNCVDKADVLMHIRGLSLALTSAPTYDIFTGERFQAGLYEDGVFVFPTDFVRYYERYDIGIPPEYEAYLLENHLVPPPRGEESAAL